MYKLAMSCTLLKNKVVEVLQHFIEDKTVLLNVQYLGSNFIIIHKTNYILSM